MPPMFGRDFEQASGGTTHIVKLEMFQPVPDGQDWSCRFTVKGGDFDMDNRSMGADSLQAACLAMEFVAINLYDSDPWKAGNLTWFGMRDIGLPFPKTFTPEW